MSLGTEGWDYMNETWVKTDDSRWYCLDMNIISSIEDAGELFGCPSGMPPAELPQTFEIRLKIFRI